MGAFLLAPLMSSVEEVSGWRGCNVILAGLCFQCAVFGMTMKPVEEEDVCDAHENTDAHVTINTENMDQGDIGESDWLEDVLSTFPPLRLLKTKPFLLLLLANPPAVMGHYLVYVYFPGVSTHSCSYTPSLVCFMLLAM